MSRGRLRTCSALIVLLCSGCAYDGSRFQYQSGGLPFLGLSLAVGHNSESAADVQVRRAGGTGSAYERDSREPLLSRIPNALRRWRAPDNLDLPIGTERVLEDKRLQTQMHAL